MDRLGTYVKGALAILAIAVIGYFAGTLADRYNNPKPVVISHGEADIGGPFTLMDTDGHPFTEANLLGRPSLIYFGYTNCPDVCPLDMNRASMALSIIEDEIDLPGVLQPVFITVDPARDTPEQLVKFLTGYHQSFIGLTGTQAQMEAAAQAYKVYWEKILESEHGGGHGEGMEKTLFNHTSYFYLMDRNGKYITHYDSSLTASQMARDLLQRLELNLLIFGQKAGRKAIFPLRGRGGPWPAAPHEWGS